MQDINYNCILDRESISESIKTFLINFEENKKNLSLKRGIYVYGAPGSGKTKFVTKLLNDLNYDIIKYDAGDIRNKSVIDTITKNNMSDKSVISLFNKKSKPIAIIMDEIDGMNNGDKGGINSLIKMIRPKKTKKQKLEELSFIPIICISSYHVDKKIKELMKVCIVYELTTPTNNQMQTILKKAFPMLDESIQVNMTLFLQGDLRKLNSINNIYKHNNDILNKEIFKNIFKPKYYNEDTKEITQKLFNDRFSISEHNTLMNDTDRTIVGLLWHENIIDVINKTPNKISMPLYKKLLDNICFSDYIDRITFQKQIWQFNEMSSLIKTFYCNKILHDTIDSNNKSIFVKNIPEIRFTKVLTKYSTEYNNFLFIQELCQKLSLDKKDTFSFFIKLRDKYSEEDLYHIFDLYEISKLDINRIYRYLDKYINKDYKSTKDDTSIELEYLETE